MRICGDYSTGLNAQLEPHTFTLPLPEEIFINFNACSYFSIIDLNADQSRRIYKKTSSNQHAPRFIYKSAPGAFRQVMSSIVAGIDIRLFR